jgi:hypothetical protein
MSESEKDRVSVISEVSENCKKLEEKNRMVQVQREKEIYDLLGGLLRPDENADNAADKEKFNEMLDDALKDGRDLEEEYSIKDSGLSKIASNLINKLISRGANIGDILSYIIDEGIKEKSSIVLYLESELSKCEEQPEICSPEKNISISLNLSGTDFIKSERIERLVTFCINNIISEKESDIRTESCCHKSRIEVWESVLKQLKKVLSD